MRRGIIISLLITLAATAVSFYLYPKLPEQMASHWNIAGEVDGYMTKFWGAYLMPIISIGCILLFAFLPKIDPLKKNIASFENYYASFIVLLVMFFGYMHALMLAWNLGYAFDMGRFILPALGVLFFYIGVILKHAKRNWFLGIRTPWTLSNDTVWKKTHDLGSVLFKISGIIAVLGIWVTEYLPWVILAPLLISVIFLIVYSYVIYRGK